MCPIILQEKPQTILTSALSEESRFHLERNSCRAWTSEQNSPEKWWFEQPQVERAEPSPATAPAWALTNQFWAKKKKKNCCSYGSRLARVVSHNVQSDIKDYNSSLSRVYLHGGLSPQHHLLPCSLEDWVALQTFGWGKNPSPGFSSSTTAMQEPHSEALRNLLFKHRVVFRERQNTMYNTRVTLSRSYSWHLHWVPSSGKNLEHTGINHSCCSQIPLCDPIHTNIFATLWHE